MQVDVISYSEDIDIDRISAEIIVNRNLKKEC